MEPTLKIVRDALVAVGVFCVVAVALGFLCGVVFGLCKIGTSWPEVRTAIGLLWVFLFLGIGGGAFIREIRLWRKVHAAKAKRP